MEYKGCEIRVRRDWVVLGDDPTAPPTMGFVAEVCEVEPPAEGDLDHRPILDFPFGVAASHLRAATEDEAVAMAKAFIDVGGKPRPPVTPHTSE